MIKSLEGMDFADRVTEVAARIKSRFETSRGNEEQTKMSLVMPFLNHILGYNVFDPTEVAAEFTADVGLKKAEKVDYAILHNGAPSMLIEVKALGVNLEKAPHDQLFRYFGCTSARIGVLTDGAVYQFFTDVDEPNKMDGRPFFEVDMRAPETITLDELKKFTRGTFETDAITAAARDLKYTREIERLIAEEVENPSEGLVRHFATRLHRGPKTQRVLEAFTKATATAFGNFIRKRISDRLKAALEPSAPAPAEPVENPKPKRESAPRRMAYVFMGEPGEERNANRGYRTLIAKFINAGYRSAVESVLSNRRNGTSEFSADQHALKGGEDEKRVRQLSTGDYLYTSLSRTAICERLEAVCQAAGMAWNTPEGLRIEPEQPSPANNA